MLSLNFYAYSRECMIKREGFLLELSGPYIHVDTGHKWSPMITVIWLLV